MEQVWPSDNLEEMMAQTKKIQPVDQISCHSSEVVAASVYVQGRSISDRKLPRLYSRHWVKPKPRESTCSVAFNSSHWTFTLNMIKMVVEQPRGGPLCVWSWTQFCGSRGEGGGWVSAVGAGRLSWGNMVELNSVCLSAQWHYQSWSSGLNWGGKTRLWELV